MSQVTDEQVKGFFEYTQSDLKQNLTKGAYQLAITEAEAGHWDDGKPRLNIRTEVSAGEHAGKFGPMHTWSIGGAEGTRDDGSEWVRSHKDQVEALIRDILSIMDGDELVLTDQGTYDEVMLAEIARQLKGRTFIGGVSEGSKGYDRITKFYPNSVPPKNFRTAEMESEFAFV